MQRVRIVFMVALAILALGSTVAAQKQTSGFGFLDDDVQLSPNPGTAVSLTWLALGAYDRLGTYTAIIVEQPEIVLHPDSTHKSLKPDALKLLADDFMNAVAGAIETSYPVVTAPGDGVLHFRWAIGNLKLKKKWSKNPLKYTPVGATAGAVKKSLSDDLTKKVAVHEMTIELELLDSQTGERLFAAREWREKGKDPTSWEELDELMHGWGRTLACRMDNARVPQDKRKNCLKPAPAS